MNKLIAIVGPSGVGKTALVTALKDVGDFTVALEQHAERPFQALFTQDARYGLANQVDYFLLRTEQEMGLRAAPLTGLVDGGLDLDYHGFTRLFYSRGLLSEAEFQLCKRLYETFRKVLPLPELIIRLIADQEIVTSRLSTRNRINIASASDFLLFESFLDEWLSTLEPHRIVEVNVSAYDPLYQHILPGLIFQIQERLRGVWKHH